MKKLLKLSITFLMASSLFACTANTNQTDASSQTEVTSEQSSKNTNNNQSTESEVTITHSKGTTTVKTNPKKVVVFDMGVLDIMDKLEVDAEFAVPVSNVPSYLPEYENATNAGGLKEPDLETIYTFAPDAIFISGRQSDYYDQLNEIAPTIYVDLDTTKYMEDLKTNVINIGKIFGKEDLALEEYNKIETKVNEAKEKISNIDDKALIVLTNSGKISAYGAGSRFGIIHDTLGFKEADENMYADTEITTHGKEVSYEYISEINPDILFVVDRDAVTGGESDATSTLNNDLVNNTNAGKNGKIIMLDPEVWYIVAGGLSSVNTMIDEAISALN